LPILSKKLTEIDKEDVKILIDGTEEFKRKANELGKDYQSQRDFLSYLPVLIMALLKSQDRIEKLTFCIVGLTIGIVILSIVLAYFSIVLATRPL